MRHSSRKNKSRSPWSFLISLAVHCVIIALILLFTAILKEPIKTPPAEFATVEFTEDPSLTELGSGDANDNPQGDLTESEEMVREQTGAIESSDRELTETVVKIEQDRIRESADAVINNERVIETTDQKELSDLETLIKEQNSRSAKNQKKLEDRERALARAKRLRELELFRQAQAKQREAGSRGAKAKGDGQRGAAQAVSDTGSKNDGSGTFATVTEGNVILVIDISLSMAKEAKVSKGKKMSGLEYVKGELIRLIRQQLNPKIQFNVIAFGSRTVPWRRAVVPAGPGLRLEAIEWVSKLKVEGGTNLFSALKLVPSHLSKLVLFGRVLV